MATKAKTRAYFRAVAWIAANDDSANGTDLNAVREGLTTKLVADVFDKDLETCAADIMRIRRTIYDQDKEC